MKVVLRCMRRSIPGSPWHALLLPETGEEGEKGKKSGKNCAREGGSCANIK